MVKIKKIVLLMLLNFAFLSGFFVFVVKADTDLTLLTTAYNETETIITTQDNSPVGDPVYEDASYSAFLTSITNLGGLAGIQAVIDEPLTTQIDADNLTADINSAIQGLIYNDTYYSTLANYSQANSIDLSPYTTDSQLLYNNELDRIELILDNPTAGNQVVSDLNADIDAAELLLVLRGDKTSLLDKKNTIDAIYSSDGSLYIPSTFLSFQNSYDNIDSVLQTDIGMTLSQLISDIDAIQFEIDIAEGRLDEVSAFLVLKPDKQDLIDDYNLATAIDESLYTTSSYSEFETELAGILVVINDVEATQTEVDQAILDLEDFHDLLISIADVTDLLAAYNLAIGLDLDSYTPNSVTLYQIELVRINIIINSDDTDQTEADQALADLQAANDILILQADRSDLITLNSLVIETYYEKRAEYTETSFTSFKNAVDAYGSYNYVNSIIDNDNIDQSTVDNLIAVMESALDLLNPMADNGELLTIYYELSAADIGEYTENSQNLYDEELDRIYLILTGQEFDAAAAAQIVIDMNNVSDLLIALPDFSDLQNIYDSTSIYRAADYSVSSYGNLIIAKENAVSTITNSNATESMVQSAIELLNDAIDNLVQKPEMIYLIQDKELDINQYVTFGQATAISYYTDDTIVVSVSDLGIVRGLNYGETKVYVELSNGYTEILDIHIKAKVTVTVYVLTFSIPAISVGIGACVVYVKKSALKSTLTSVKSIFKRKK